MKQVQIRFAGDNKCITKHRGIVPMFGYQGQFFIADVMGEGGDLPFNALGSGRAKTSGGGAVTMATGLGIPPLDIHWLGKEVWHQALGCCSQK